VLKETLKYDDDDDVSENTDTIKDTYVTDFD
jgi:hypothetical protein